ncbi:MAG: glycine zipper family protein [Alphaproteobacteria bacterium]
MPAAPAGASGLFIYPNKNQSQEQQHSDEGECSQWAQQQTGYSPYSSSSYSFGRPALRGAARGAALGAIGGAIGGDAGKGAAIGAGVGGAAGLMRRGRAERAEAAHQDDFVRAFATCMNGRGYTVN